MPCLAPIYLLLMSLASASGELVITQLTKVVNDNTLPSVVQFNVTVLAVSPSTIYNVTVTSGSTVFTLSGTNGIIEPVNNPYLSTKDNALITWRQPFLSHAQNPMSLIYQVQPTKDSSGVYLLPQGTSYYNSTVLSSSSGPALTATSCFERVNVDQTNVVNNNTFAVITVIVGLLLGAASVSLILCIIHRWTPLSALQSNSVLSSMQPHYERHRNASDVSLNDSWVEIEGHIRKTSASKKSIQSSDSLLEGRARGDSIVALLRQKNSLSINRELNRLSINSIVEVYSALRTAWLSSMLPITRGFVENISFNDLIAQSALNKSLQTFEKKLVELDKKLSLEQSMSMETLRTEFNTKTEAEMTSLDEKQDKLVHSFDEQTRHLDGNERDPVYKLINEEYEVRRDDLNSRLILMQGLREEKLKEEIFTKKCLGIKSLQNDLIKDITSRGKLSPDNSESLTNELARMNTFVTETFCDALCSRLAALDNQHARRKYLALSQDLNKKLQAEILNLISSQLLKMITLSKKVVKMTEDEVDSRKDNILKKVMKLKEANEKEKTEQELDLLQRSREQKELHMTELMNKYDQKLKVLQKKQDIQENPDGFVKVVQAMTTERIEEIASLENELDTQDANELQQIRKTCFDLIHSQLLDIKEKTAGDLKNCGVSNKKLESWLDDDDIELRELSQEHKKTKKQNENRLKKHQTQDSTHLLLHKRRQQFDDKQLINYRAIFIRKLLDIQSSLTNTERDRLQRDYELKAVSSSVNAKLSAVKELSLHVHLTQRVANQRASQLENLCRKQQLQIKKVLKQSSSSRRRDTDDDEDEDDDRGTEQDLLALHQKHCEERLAVLKDTADVDETEIEEMLLKEQANGIKREEEEIGRQLAQMLINKAKPIVEDEERRRIIYRLTFDLSNTVIETGLLTSSQYLQLLQSQKQISQNMSLKLDEEERSEEKILVKQLNEQHQLMTSKQHKEGKSKQESSIKLIKQGISSAEQPINDDQLGLKLDKESVQALEDLRRKTDVKRRQKITQQEIDFLGDLIRIAGFLPDQIELAVLPLIPISWSTTKTKDLVDKLCEYCIESDSPSKNKFKLGLFNNQKKLAEELPKKSNNEDTSDLSFFHISGSTKKAEDLFALNAVSSTVLPLHNERFRASSQNLSTEVLSSYKPPRYDASSPAPIRPIIRQRSNLSESHHREHVEDESHFDLRHGLPDRSMERTRKTVRVSESNQYFSHSDYDEDW